jgi:adenosylcobinamide-phosphate synthase
MMARRRSRLSTRMIGAAVGLLADRELGEPPSSVHPVAAFGRVMTSLEDAVFAPTRAAGMRYTTLGVGIGFGMGAPLPTAAVVALAAAGRALRGAAAEVHDALVASDIDRARSLVPTLVGRDPSALDASGLSAAVIESLAENTVDAVVAPVWWAVVGGSGAGSAYRAVNTMDAMVGHHSERYEDFGWASARLDDVANYVPARLTALLTACVRPSAAPRVARAVREHAPLHPSPNAGVAEAAFAAALRIELGGPLRYGTREEDRPRLGAGPRPDVDDIDRAIALASHVELALVGMLLFGGLTGRLVGQRRRNGTP